MPRAKNHEIRQKILEKSYELFLEKGYDNVMLKEIAKECGITATLLQHYFSRKEEILVHIVYNLVFRTSEFLYNRTEIFSLYPIHINHHLWTGLYYRLFYTLLCREDDRLLRLYTGVLYNAPLLRRGLTLSIERIMDDGFEYVDRDLPNSFETYLLNGFLSQLVAMNMRNNRLSVSHELIVNTALSAYYRYMKLTAEEEAEMFGLISKHLTPSLLEEYLQFVDDHIRNYIPIE